MVSRAVQLAGRGNATSRQTPPPPRAGCNGKDSSVARPAFDQPAGFDQDLTRSFRLKAPPVCPTLGFALKRSPDAFESSCCKAVQLSAAMRPPTGRCRPNRPLRPSSRLGPYHACAPKPEPAAAGDPALCAGPDAAAARPGQPPHPSVRTSARPAGRPAATGRHTERNGRLKKANGATRQLSPGRPAACQPSCLASRKGLSRGRSTDHAPGCPRSN